MSSAAFVVNDLKVEMNVIFDSSQNHLGSLTFPLFLTTQIHFYIRNSSLQCYASAPFNMFYLFTRLSYFLTNFIVHAHFKYCDILSGQLSA